jgi:periplasmic protein TonB
MMPVSITTKPTPGDFLRESFTPVLIVSLLFHTLLFSGIVILTKALYESKEFQRPYTFELIRLSSPDVFESPVHPGPTAAPQMKSARQKAIVPPAVILPQQPVADKNIVPGEKKADAAVLAETTPAAGPTVEAVQTASKGQAVDAPVAIDKVYETGMVDEPPVPLKGNQKPFYPEFVKDQEISGTVTAQIVIDETGKVIEIKILSSPHELLSDEVTKAISRWKYKPGKIKGVAVKVKDRNVRVDFQLTD